MSVSPSMFIFNSDGHKMVFYSFPLFASYLYFLIVLQDGVGKSEIMFENV